MSKHGNLIGFFFDILGVRLPEADVADYPVAEWHRGAKRPVFALATPCTGHLAIPILAHNSDNFSSIDADF
jgi:hypothetical protein